MRFEETDPAFHVRREMQKLGWWSEDRLSDSGWRTFGYSIWFRRWDWHDLKFVDGATFGDKVKEPQTEAEINAAVARAANTALIAWENFPIYPPSFNCSTREWEHNPMYDYLKKQGLVR